MNEEKSAEDWCSESLRWTETNSCTVEKRRRRTLLRGCDSQQLMSLLPSSGPLLFAPPSSKEIHARSSTARLSCKKWLLTFWTLQWGVLMKTGPGAIKPSAFTYRGLACWILHHFLTHSLIPGVIFFKPSSCFHSDLFMFVISFVLIPCTSSVHVQPTGLQCCGIPENHPTAHIINLFFTILT